ncbi:hypothetical protein AALP_AA6G165600 [Arabis alpina]|uniref:Uncharacterized protein n=1 Tax=Arabis alpina TaxID=50452 RepID=A0A087GPP0_ARAAL|nr:hypothetical protein AALP_AA6G165600 [Arabis alpina]
MKYGSVLFVVSCVIGFLILSHVKEVEGQKDLGCNMDVEAPGHCGNNGKSLCEEDLRKKLRKIPSAPKDIKVACNCTDRPHYIKGYPHYRVCDCRTDCPR